MKLSKSKEYEMAIKIAGEVEKSFMNSTKLTRKELQQIAKQAAMTNQASRSMASQFSSGVEAVSGGFGKLESFAVGAFEAVAKAATVTADAVGTVAAASISVGSSFEAQMSTVKALTNATEADFQTLNETAKHIGETTSFSATEAGQAMEYMAMAGWKTSDIIGGIGGIMDLAAASGEELAGVSDIVTDALTAFGLSASDAGHFADVLAAASTNSNTNVSMMGETFQYAAPLAGALGYSVEDTAVAIGLMANAGIKASAAGTALRKIFAETTNGATVTAEAFGEMNIQTQNSDGSMRDLNDIIVDLRAAFEQMTDSEKAANAEAIAGKTAMSGLLAIVNASEGDFDKLTDAMNNCEGAAAAMADIKLDNLQGDVTLFKSAMEGIGIEIYEQFNAPLREGVQAGTEFVGMLTNYLKNSGAVQKVTSNIVKALPTFIRQAKSAGGAAMELMEPLFDIAEYMINHPDVIAAGLAAIGGAIATYKVAEGIKSVINAFSGIGVVMSNPVALGITAVAAAIAGVAAIITKVKLKERELKEENLAEHFGSITLSIEELEKAAKHIIGADSLGQLSEMMSNLEGLDQYKNSIKESVEELNKLNWKVNIGMELDESDKADYISNIESYITDCLDYAEQNNYTVSLAMSLMAGDSEVGTQIKESTTQFYNSAYGELESLGKQLNEVVNTAWQDDLLTIDEVEQIQKIQKQMADIQNKMAISEFDAKMEVLNIQYAGGELDADTFQNLQAELSSEMEEVKANLEESLTISIAAAKLQLDEGKINQAGYDEVIKEFTENYYNQVADVELKVGNFSYDTILQQYSEELEAIVPELKGKTDEVIKEIIESYNSSDLYGDKYALIDSKELMARLGINEIDEATRDALSQLYEQIEPIAAGLKQTKEKMVNAGMEVPQALSEGISDLAALGTVSESAEAVFTLVGEVASDSPEYRETLKKWHEGGMALPDEIVTALREKDADIERAVRETYNALNRYSQNILGQGIDIDIPLNINITANASGNVNIPGTHAPYPTYAAHAEGGIFNTPHFALFAEAGPEAVIPINNTQNAYNIWRQTGELMGMKNELELSDAAVTMIDNESSNVISSPQITYAPTLQFYGGTPDKDDIAEAEKLSQEEFEAMLEKYYKDKGRVKL